MKDVSEITACICDFGFFTSLAQKMAEVCKSVYYHTPVEDEFQSVQKCVFGDGLPDVERLDEIFTEGIYEDIDLFVFPDIGFNEVQKFLREQGKAVWGSMGLNTLEQSRTGFLEKIKQLGLPVAPWKQCVGLTELSKELKTRKSEAYVKLNRFRSDMESWKHVDWSHSEREIERLAKLWGGMKEYPVFAVQDLIEDAQEVGFDGWSVDGRFPIRGFAGYEDKNELYLGALREYAQLPEQVKRINEAFSPVLKESGYRNFFSTEIRIQNGKPYFIDPTLRCPGQTGEQLIETCYNLPDCIWSGANGELIKPSFEYKFAASATIHDTAGTAEDWRVLKVPEKVAKWTKLAHFVFDNGVFHFPPGRSAELGVVISGGNSFEEVFDNLKENLEAFEDQPVSYELDGFYDLVKTIEESEEEGIEFSDEPVPDAAEALSSVLS